MRTCNKPRVDQTLPVPHKTQLPTTVLRIIIRTSTALVNKTTAEAISKATHTHTNYLLYSHSMQSSSYGYNNGRPLNLNASCTWHNVDVELLSLIHYFTALRSRCSSLSVCLSLSLILCRLNKFFHLSRARAGIMQKVCKNL